MIPAIIIPILVGVVPFGWGVYLSFTDWRLANPGISFIGFENYLFLFQDRNFWKAVLISFEYVGLAISIELCLGALIAHLLTKNRRGQWFFRSIIVIPLTVAPVLLALMWKLMLSTSGGVVNYLLGFIGIQPVAWLANPSVALSTLAFIDAYIYTPFIALILFAGLQNLPHDPYEAALVDGASGWDCFRYITWPLMRPLVLVSIMLRLVVSFKIFDTFYSTTGGTGQCHYQFAPLGLSQCLPVRRHGLRHGRCGNSLRCHLFPHLHFCPYVERSYILPVVYRREVKIASREYACDNKANLMMGGV